MTCDECGGIMETRTDDFYNSDHTKLQCPLCGHWHDLGEQMNNSVEYTFTPEENITAHEIALFLASCNRIVSAEIVESLPDNMRRHFTKID